MTIDQREGGAESEQEKAAREYALLLLGRRSFSCAELKARLEERGFSPAASEAAVGFASDYGYLNDEELARREAEHYFRERGLGPYRVALRLRQRCIAPELITEVIAAYSEADLRELCLTAARKKLRALGPNLGHVTVQRRVAAHLGRKGFPASTIAWCLKQLGLEDAETGTP